MRFNMLGDANHAGPVRLSDTYDKEVGGAQTGIAASQKALYDAYNSLNSRMDRSSIDIPLGGDSQTHVYMQKRSGVVCAHIMGLAKLVAGGYDFGVVIPQGYRPYYIIRTVTSSGNSVLPIYWHFTPSGTINTYNYGDAINDATNNFGSVSYLA